MPEINFNVSKEDSAIAYKIAKRAVEMAKQDGIKYDLLDAQMDIIACHANGNPLRLTDLLNADDSNFGHDVYGIRRFIDRRTGRLTKCFSPRFSAPEA